MSAVEPVGLLCPACAQEFSSPGCRCWAPGPEIHTDLHRPARDGSVLPALVAVCPECGCADWAAEFGRAAAAVADLPASAVQGAAAYAEAARQSAVYGDADDAVGQLWWRGSWCARDEGSADLERECQREAVACWRRGWDQGALLPRERQVAAYLLGELLRRLGETEAALAWWDQALEPVEAASWAPLLSVVRPLAAAGDSRPATVTNGPWGPPPARPRGRCGEALAAIWAGNPRPAMALADGSLAPHLIELLGQTRGVAGKAARAALGVLAPLVVDQLRPYAGLEGVPPLLARVGDPGALEPLLRALHRRDRPRIEVLEALAELGDRRAYDALAATAEATRWPRGLARALAELGGERARDRLWEYLPRANRGDHDELVEALDRTGALAGPAAARLVCDVLQREVAEIIARCDPADTAELLAARLWQLSGSERLRAVEWLRQHGRPPGAAVVLPLLHGHSEADIHQAVLTLGRLGDPAAVEPLLDWLRRPWQDPKGYNALDVAGSWAKPPTGCYRNCASDLDRLPAIWALGQLRDPRAYETLVALTAAPATRGPWRS